MQTNELKKIAVIGIAFVVGFPLLKKLADAQNRIAAETEEQQRDKYIVHCKKGKPPKETKYTINLLTIRDKIYDAFYNADMFGITEDEETAINTLKLVPKTRIGQLSVLYRTKYNKDLRGDFIKFLNQNEYARVQTLLN